MSANLNAPALVGGQVTPEITVNDAIGTIDAAVTEILVIDLTNSVSLTAAQYRSAVRFSVTPTGVSKVLTLPAVKRLVLVTNDGTNTISITVGTTTVSLTANSAAFLYTDGTANGLLSFALSSSVAPPNDISVFVPGAPTASQVCLRLTVVRSFTLPISLTGSAATAGTASTGTATFTIKQNGTSIGTIVFTTSATATFTFAAAVTFAVNDIITVTAPSSADATLADIAISFLGHR